MSKLPVLFRQCNIYRLCTANKLFLETDVSGKRGENHGVLPVVTMNVLLLEDILIQRTAVPVRPFVALLLSFF